MEFKFKDQSLVKSNALKVLNFLFSFLQQCGNNDVALKNNILTCLCSWVRSGSISADVILSCSLVQLSFQVLQSSDTFDAAVDILTELVLSSAQQPRNEALVQSIYPNLLQLVPFLKQNSDDQEIMSGICKILVEAGEGYADLIASNFASFSGILEGLLICTAVDDLEIARLTANAWYQITEHILQQDNSPQFKAQFFPVFRPLTDILVNHMRYPLDYASLTAQDRDEFREYRHEIGDILKDCVRILGDEAALESPFLSLKKFYGLDADVGSKVAWQEVEAPLFSLRVMCREISNTESKYIPEIMAMLPRLPAHPKVTYAAILVIGRFAQWTNMHPEMLTHQLDFVSKGFQAEKDTTIAAAHAFRDLCKYCNKV
jgi:transportin-3